MKEIKELNRYTRDAVFSELSEWCHFSGTNDFMEVTEWKNGEGFDVLISRKYGDKIFNMTYGEYDLFKELIREIEK